MDTEKLVEKIVGEHIAQSLREMRDPAKFHSWLDGQRAKEEAKTIVAMIVEEARKKT